jgi:hypothetical protein
LFAGIGAVLQKVEKMILELQRCKLAVPSIPGKITLGPNPNPQQ